MLLAALAYGAVVSFSRVASGAHFLSDSVVSFFVMLICADVLHHYLIVPVLERSQAAGWTTDDGAGRLSGVARTRSARTTTRRRPHVSLTARMQPAVLALL